MANADSGARERTERIKRLLNDVAREVRDDIDKVSDPKARALFEATGDVLEGLQKAYESYEQSDEPWIEPEWQRQEGC